MQRMPLMIPTRIPRGTRIQQRHDRIGVAPERSNVQRRAAKRVGLVDHGEEPPGAFLRAKSAEVRSKIELSDVVAQAHDDLVEGVVVGFFEDVGEGEVLGEEVGGGGVLFEP